MDSNDSKDIMIQDHNSGCPNLRTRGVKYCTVDNHFMSKLPVEQLHLAGFDLLRGDFGSVFGKVS